MVSLDHGHTADSAQEREKTKKPVLAVNRKFVRQKKKIGDVAVNQTCEAASNFMRLKGRFQPWLVIVSRAIPIPTGEGKPEAPGNLHIYMYETAQVAGWK